MDSIDLSRAFKAPFADKDWPMKTLLGFVWFILGLTIPAVWGAQIEYIRRVSRGDETLPEWNDFGEKWVQGFLIGVAGFIYFLPVVLLSFVFLVPVALHAASGGDSTETFGALIGGGVCFFLLLATLYSVAVSIFFYAAQVNYAMNGTFGSLFDIRGVMDRVRGRTGYFTAWLYALVVSIALSTASSLVSSLTGGIGAILTPAVGYITLMMVGHILGQWATRAYGVPTPQPVYTTAPGVYVPPAPPTPPAYAPPASPTPPAYEPPAGEPQAYQPPAAPTPPMAPEVPGAQAEPESGVSQGPGPEENAPGTNEGLSAENPPVEPPIPPA